MSLAFKFKLALPDFTLQIEAQLDAQKVTALFGPSGSGKTRLLRLIAGLDKCQQGSIQLFDDIWQNQHHFVPAWQRGIAYVFQEPSLFEHLTVQGNLDFAAKRANQAESSLSSDDIIEMLDLSALLSRKVQSLSGGQQQRVAIARALCRKPRLLLMDEPLSALDGTAKRRIMPYLESLRNETKIPLIYVSHSLHELIRLADDILVIKDGQLQEFGRIEEVLNRAQYSLWPGDEVESLVYANLVEHDTKYGLTILDSDLGRLTVSALDVPLGQTVRVTLAARDVSITLEHQQSTSILNVFAAEVIDIQTIDKAQV